MKLLLWVALISVPAFADIRIAEFYKTRLENKKTELLFHKQTENLELQTKSVKEYTYNQTLDYKSWLNRSTFRQRYFVNSEFVTGDPATAPVLYFLCGEAECSANAATRSLSYQAQRLGAHVVSVEHRYYGKSLPFQMLTTENLKYLSTDYALRDALNVQKHIIFVHKLTGPWVVAGGSYAGSLAAYYRQRYPQHVKGALSSSGPVMAKENFEEYDQHVSQVVGPECGAQMKKVVAQIEAELSNPEKLLEIKKSFKGELLTDDVDFLYLIADMGALAVQYGYRDRFCKELNQADPILGYAKFTREIFREWQMDALSMSAAGAMEPDSTKTDSGMRQWFYQSCTEYGYWQNAYHEEAVSVRSARINKEYHHNICKRLFGIDQAGNEAFVNQKYYEPLLNESTSHILFTNGSRDPWMKLSITPENNNAVNPNTQAHIIPEASHCDDLRNLTTPEILKAKQLFTDQIKEWIQ